jgi:hypothetical protein
MAWGGEIPPHPAAYYRRQAARARRVAEGVTTQAVKARLLDDARYNDGLAAKAEALGQKLRSRNFWTRHPRSFRRSGATVPQTQPSP